MYDTGKKNFKRRKKGRDTITHAEVVNKVAYKTGFTSKTASKIIYTYLSHVVDAIKSREIVPVPLVGSFALAPGRVVSGKYGSSEPHSQVYLWVDRQLRAECYYLRPNESTIREQDRDKVPELPVAQQKTTP